MTKPPIQLKTLSLKNHADYDERWLQDAIEKNPEVLGMGELIVKDRERVHSGAGRLDLLLQDPETHGRFEVEIQLGASDPSHIIRTIEYWDLERRRFPQYEHTAVLIAEDITSRFLNVVSLFNGFIPIMAIQLSAIETNEGIGLHFTKILDTVELGLVDEDEQATKNVDRAFWESKSAPETMGIADEMLELIKEIAPSAEQNPTQQYIGLKVNGKPFNLATFMPQKKAIRIDMKLEQSSDLEQEFENRDITSLGYDKIFRAYKLKFTKAEADQHKEYLKELFRMAYDRRK